MMKVKDFLNGFQAMRSSIDYIGIFDAQRRELFTGEPVRVPSGLQDVEVLHAEFTPEVNASVIVPAVLREVKEIDIY